MNALRHLAPVLIGGALALGGARAAEIGPSTPPSEGRVAQQPLVRPNPSGHSAGLHDAGLHDAKPSASRHPGSRPQSVHAGTLRLPIRTPGTGSAATFAAAARPGTQPRASPRAQPQASPGTQPQTSSRSRANRSTTVLTAIARSAVVGGPRTQVLGTLGGPQSSISMARGARAPGGPVPVGLSGNALRRRF